jgi:hypothetical protein
VAAVIEDFSGIENVFRIERVFDFAHDAEQLIAQLLFNTGLAPLR